MRNEANQSAAQQTLGQISGDRPCANCGFTLYGQPITREPKYGLVIARCPECGTVAALQEYPIIRSWVRRLGAAAALAWAVVLLGWFALGAGTFAVPLDDVREEIAQPLSDEIATAYRTWLDASPSRDMFAPPVGRDGSAAVAMLPPDGSRHTGELGEARETTVTRTSNITEAFLATDSHRELAGGLWPGRAFRQGPLMPLAAMALIVFLVSVGWSVLLLHLGRVSRVVVALVQIALAVALHVASNTNAARPTAAMGYMIDPWMMGRPPASGDTVYALAYASAWWPALGAMLLVGCAAAVLGALAGRPLARLVLVAALPPRLRVPFHELWRVDRKALRGIRTRQSPAADA